MTMPSNELPTLQQYIAELPNGWASYPACRASAQMIASLVVHGAFDELEGMPLPVSTTLHVSPDDEVAEVVNVGSLLAILDGVFGGDAERFLTWATEGSAQRMTTMRFAAMRGHSAARLIAELPRVWSTYHHGTTLRVTELKDETSRMVLDYPPGLFPSVFLEYFARSVAVALIRVDAPQPVVTVATIEVDGRAEATLALRWDAG
jgi:hypothetical protein